MRRIVKTVLLTVAALLVLTLGAVAALLAWFDPEDYRDTLVEAVETATGRAFSVDGEMVFVPSLAPHFSISGVRLANPGWARVPNMVTFGRLEAEADLVSLLGGRVDIRRIVLTNPEVNLEIAEDGSKSWDFPTRPPEEQQAATAPEPQTSAPPAIVFSTIRIERGHVRLLDRRNGRSDYLDINHLVALMEDADGPIHTFGSLTFNGESLSLTGSFGNLATLLSNQPFGIDLVATAAGARLSVAGRVAAPLQARGIDLAVRTEGRALEDLGRLVVAATGKAAPVPALGPYSLGLRLAGDPGALGVEQLEARIGQQDGILVEVRGAMADLVGAAGIALEFTGRIASLQPLGALSPDPLPALTPVAFSAALSGSKDALALHEIDIRMGRSRLQGLVEVEPQTAPLRVKAHVTAPFLDLVDIVPQPPQAGPLPAAIPAAAVGAQPAEPVPDEGPSRIFSDRPLPLELLRKVSADVHVRADEIVAGNLRVGAAEMRAFLRRGVFHVTRAGGRVGGGELNASFTIDGRKPNKISLHTGLTAEKIEIGQVLRDTGADQSVTGAPIDVRLSLTGAGGSLHDLMASLAGDVLIEVGPGRLENPYVDLIGADLLNETIAFLNPFSQSDTGTDLQCGVMAAVLRGGRALIDETIAIETGKTLLVVDGQVDLGAETIDLAVETKSRGGFTVSAGALAGLMRLGGTFQEPSIGFDTGGVARTAASIAAAVATSGVSLLAEAVVGAVTRDSNPCRTALVRAKSALTATN